MTELNIVNSIALTSGAAAPRKRVAPTYLAFRCRGCRVRVVAGDDGMLHVSLIDVIVALDHMRAEAEQRPACGFVSNRELDEANPIFTSEEALVATIQQQASEAGQVFLSWYHTNVRALPGWSRTPQAETMIAAEEDAIIERAFTILQTRLAVLQSASSQ